MRKLRRPAKRCRRGGPETRQTLTGVEVMPFHSLGRDKRRRLGRPETPARSSATSRQSRSWLEALASRGCDARLG